MAEDSEKRGPVEKTNKGWPINPFGIIALTFFALIIIFLIIKPLYTQKNGSTNGENLQQNNAGGRIISPQAGEIIRSDFLKIELSTDNPTDVAKIQFWAKTYADGKWQMIGEVTQTPFSLNWQIPPEFTNKAIAITSHIYQNDGQIIKDPGGWREGVIILSN